MCVAILNPKEVLISKETFIKCANTNSDGMGLVIAKDGKLEIHKELEDVDKFYDIYKRLREENPAQKIVIHFRMSTQGSISLDNAHPFLIHDGLAFVHNGIVSGMGFDGKKSDTVIYNEMILRKLPKDFIKNRTILKLLVEYGGGYNKFIFLDNKGYALIMGEKKGDWDKEGNWFSNTHWKFSGFYRGYEGHNNYGGYQKITKNEPVIQDRHNGWVLIDGVWKLESAVEKAKSVGKFHNYGDRSYND